MKRRDSKKKSFGRITSGLIAQDNLSLKTIEFVCLQLPAWRDDPNRPFEESEPKLNSQLCDFLDAQAKNLFSMVRFKHEEHSPVEGLLIYQRSRLRASLLKQIFIQYMTQLWFLNVNVFPRHHPTVKPNTLPAEEVI